MATLDPRRVREAFPEHELPKEVKHYDAKEAVSIDNDRDIAHPKVGVSYQKSVVITHIADGLAPTAKVRYKKKVSSDLNYLDDTEVKSYAATAWRLLA